MVICYKSCVRIPQPIAVFSLLGLLAGACSNRVDQAKADIAGLDTDRDRTLGFLSHETDRFTAVFGGRTDRDVKHFLDERIHHLVNMEEEIRVDHESRHRSWLQEKEKSGGKRSRRGEAGAANLSMQLWLQGLLDETTITVFFQGRSVPVNNPRAGIVLLGRYYSEFPDAAGTWHQTPVEFRRSILVHEARHSDCTGGISDKSLEIARSSTSHEEFLDRFQQTGCGHLHAICPPGHSQEGSTACDRHPWGSYAVQWLYLLGRLSKSPYDGLTKEEWKEVVVMEALAIDTKSRLLYDAEAMLEGKLGEPDMTSQGKVE